MIGGRCLLYRLYYRIHFKIHQVKINIFSVDLEKMGKHTQLSKAILFIKSDGAGIVAAYFKIYLLKAVFLGEGKNCFRQRRRRAAAPPIYPNKSGLVSRFSIFYQKIIADFCERFYPFRIRRSFSPLHLPPYGVPSYMG